MSFFWIAALSGGALLVIATIYLVVMNWGEEMYPRLVSAFGVGALTLLVAVLAALKGSREEMKFTTSVIVDEATQKPPLLIPNPSRAFDPHFQRLNDLATLTLEIKETPPSDEIFSYYADLWQHKLLTDLRDIQRRGTGWQW